jgi:hypothetical protein
MNPKNSRVTLGPVGAVAPTNPLFFLKKKKIMGNPEHAPA